MSIEVDDNGQFGSIFEGETYEAFCLRRRFLIPLDDFDLQSMMTESIPHFVFGEEAFYSDHEPLVFMDSEEICQEGTCIHIKCLDNSDPNSDSDMTISDSES